MIPRLMVSSMVPCPIDIARDAIVCTACPSDEAMRDWICSRSPI